jgi:hypothetical protein
LIHVNPRRAVQMISKGVRRQRHCHVAVCPE